MNKLNILIWLLFSSLLFCQIEENNVVNTKLPTIVPPSTEAFSFTKYGNLPISEFTGMFNLSVPVYSFKANKIEVPISLNYSTNGLKVNDYPTKTGMSWLLNVGGVITRTIKDQPDEQTIGGNYRVKKSTLELNNLNTADGTSGATTLVSYIENPSFDSEADVFNYNFMGYSGSFILDENYNPLLINEESELKITILGDLRTQREFLIITPDGIKYYFGGTNAVESSFKNSIDGDLPIGDTAYHLTKIIDNENTEVYFEYTNSNGLTQIGRNESVTMLTYNEFPTECLPLISPPSGVVFSSQFQKISNIKVISKVFSNVNSESVNYFYLNVNGKKILDKIEILNRVNNVDHLINRVKLNYLGLDAFSQNNFVKRFFLQSIVFNDEFQLNNNKKLIWSFEYDDPFGLPDRLSYAVDEYGYYNGKTNNSTMLPKVHIPHQFPGVANNYIYPGADKTGDFNFAKKGTLIKVNYPTKGFSLVEYESNPFKNDLYTDYENYIFSNDGVTNASIPGVNNLSEENVTLSPVFKDQLVKIYYTTNSNNFPANHTVRLSLKVTNISDNSIVYDNLVNLGMVSSTREFEVSILKDKLYKFEIFIFNPSTIALGTYVNATLKFKLFTDITTIQGEGLRVKKIIDYSKNSIQSDYKRFYYMPTNLLNLPVHQQPIKYPYTNKYFKYSMVWKLRPAGCNGSAGEGGLDLSAYLARFTTLTSNSISDYFNNNGFGNIVNPVVVTSFGGDNFENGGVERIYHTDTNFSEYGSVMLQNYNSDNDFNTAIASNDFATLINNNSTISGDLVKEYYFKKTGNSFFKQKQINKIYQKTRTPSYINLVGKRVFDIALFTEQNPHTQGTATSNYFLKQYATLTFRNILESSEQIEYFEDIFMPNITFSSNVESEGSIILVDETNDSGFKKIITTQNYEYGSLKGLPTVITTNTSDSAVVNKTVNTYVNTASSLPSIPGNQSDIYTSLISQNRVGSPIQTQQLQNAELLATQRTLFNNFTVNSITKILPEKIQISKAEQPLEDKAIFYNYDERFNPVVMGYANAPKTRYMFNSEGLVIAKIENYTGTSTTFPLITGNIDNSSCALQTEYINSDVTVFIYNLITKKLIQTIDARCQNTFYEYDDLHRLKLIKDHDGNIVKEFDQQFKSQD